MAKCSICGKGAHFGNAVSHSHRRSNKMWKSNVKSVKVKTEGGAKKMYVCTSCLKSDNCFGSVIITLWFWLLSNLATGLPAFPAPITK